MKLLTTTFLTSSLALATEILSNSNLDFAYATHLAKYGITYESREEFEERKVEFAKTDELIRQHNESNDVEELTYTLGHNKLSTLSEEERDSMLGLRSISPLDGPIELRGALLGSDKPGSYKQFSTLVPDAVDWRDEGAVTPIADQGHCGSCWTFMSTGALEGAYKIAGGELYNLSEQQILDCAGTDIGGYGCDGGDVNSGFEYFMQNNAINATDYPYTGSQQSCQASGKNTTNVWVKTYNYVTPANGDQIRAALATGPVGVAINASGIRFQFYRSGVFECAGCGDSENDLNHAVLLVGYGYDSDAQKDYFILKNQWGTSWGEQGYMKIVNLGEGNGQSGINLWPIIPVASNLASGLMSVTAILGVTFGLFIA